jgi:hypothetical protein
MITTARGTVKTSKTNAPVGSTCAQVLAPARATYQVAIARARKGISNAPLAVLIVTMIAQGKIHPTPATSKIAK